MERVCTYICARRSLTTVRKGVARDSAMLFRGGTQRFFSGEGTMNAGSLGIAPDGAARVIVAAVAVNGVQTQDLRNLQIRTDAAYAAGGRL